MKLKLLILTVITSILFSCEQKKLKNEVPVINSHDQLMSQFADPSSEYRTVPFWVWNNDVSKEDVDRFLREYKEKGFGGVFIHPRYGMITEYLSPKWFELIKYSTDVAKELGLKIWIYDEDSYPSGFAGGHVNEQMPESYNQGIALAPVKQSKLNLDSKNMRIKYVYKKEGNEWKDITATASKEDGAEGDYLLFNLRDARRSIWYGGYSYVDLLIKGVTEKFIDITFPGYKNSVGEDFGKTVMGVFTDEPHTDPDFGGTIRWSPDLNSRFKQLFEYDLDPKMISVYQETGDWKKVRHDYYATILDMFINRWSLPMGQYCKDNNLIWTGHYWEHGWPSPAKGPDNMAMYAFHDMPGIDLLFNNEKERPDQFGNIRSPKELSSVANQLGKKRTLSETYGGSGWDFRFDEMKRNGDWEYVLGVNFMNQHLSYVSLMGDRKHDYPQSFGPYAPYWKQYKYQNDYFGRLSAALSSGKQVNKVLVLEPTTTAWMYYSPNKENTNPRFDKINPTFRAMLSLFEQKQVEYDLGCENIIRDYGKVNGNSFSVGLCDYDVVIIPDVMDNFEASTFKLLKKYVANGGKVIQFGEGAEFIDARPTEQFASLTSKENWIKYPEANAEAVDKYLLPNDLKVTFAGTEGQLYHHRRQLSDGEIIFFSNFDAEAVSEAEVTVKAASVVGLCNHEGKTFPVAYKKSGEMVSFPIKLYPAGSYMVYAYKEKVVEPAPVQNIQKTLVSTVKSEIKMQGPNILNVDYLKMKIGSGPEKTMFFKFASDSIYKHFGFKDGNPWFQSSQFKTQFVDMEKNFKEGDSFEVAYPFEISAGVDMKGMKLVIERPWLYVVTLNGEAIQPEKGEFWLDPAFSVFNVEKQLKTGKNELRLAKSKFSVHCEIEPIYLLGNFTLESLNQGWKVVPARKPLDLGSWKAQGYPFFGESVKYSKSLQVDKTGKYEIELTDWSGTVAAVNVNGKEAGIIQAKPYNLTVELNQGKNDIDVVVIGSLKNPFGPHHGTTYHGMVRPYIFQNAPKVQLAGNSYSTNDYGLMKDFNIYALN
jgi:hypothetical protein